MFILFRIIEHFFSLFFSADQRESSNSISGDEGNVVRIFSYGHAAFNLSCEGLIFVELCMYFLPLNDREFRGKTSLIPRD